MSKKTYTGSPKKKGKKRKGKQKNRKLRLVAMIILILICVVIAGGFGLLHVKFGINPKTIVQFKQEAVQLVQESTVETFRPNKASVVYSEDEREITKLYMDENSTYLTFDEIPKDVINAFVAVEDRTFWENSGIDNKGIVRVVLNYIRTGGKTAHGASTITQQVARDIFLTNEKSLERKIKEIFIAQEMTKKYDKELIIEFYCNNCCFANAIYGIEDASQSYLGKPAADLTLAEASYLCAIPNRPEYYDPWDSDPANARTRGNKILGDMVECEFITQAECDAAKEEEIALIDRQEKKDAEEFHNYATSTAVKYATEYLMEYKYEFQFRYSFQDEADYQAYREEYQTAYSNAKRNLKTGGYQIYTSLDLDATAALQKALDENLKDHTAVNVDENGLETYNLQGAITAIDNETGKIVAAVGGRTQEGMPNMISLNRAVDSPRQPGSAIKPLVVYGPAVDAGYNAKSVLTNVDPDEAKGKSAAEILKMTGEPVDLRTAVEQSYNGPVYWLASTIGIDEGMAYLEAMEFDDLHPNDYNLSTALGGMTRGATTADMANAYYTLVNHGVYTKADCLLSILDGDGEEIYETPESKQVYEEDAADQMVDILKGVLTRGTAKKINWYGSSSTEAIGKTGTTNDNKDGSFSGATPYYTISVWVGNDDNTKVSGLSGSSYPARIWKDAMLAMINGLPKATFDLNVPQELTYETSTLPEKTEEEVPEGELPEGTLPEGTAPESGAPGTVPGADPQPGGSSTPNTPPAPEEPSGGTTIDGSISGGTIDGDISGDEGEETVPGEDSGSNTPEQPAA